MTRETISLRFQDRQGRWFEGVLVGARFEAEGIVLLADLAPQTAPQVAIAEAVDLFLEGGPDRRIEEIAARLVYTGRRPDAFHCQFRAGAEARSLVLPALNNRQALRVRPDESAVQVTVRGRAGEEIRPVVSDISCTGLSLLVPSDEEAGRLPEWQVELVIRLPGQDEPIEMAGTLQYCQLQGAAVLYGIEFAQRATTLFRHKQALIQRFVVRHQIEVLARARREREEGRRDGRVA